MPGEEWRGIVAAWPIWLRHEWGERAAVREYDGGATRARAEWLAFLDVVSQRLGGGS